MANNPTNTAPYSADRYLPSPQDVLAVKQILLTLCLPLELIDTIVDHGEYWPHAKMHRQGTAVTVRNGDNRFLLRSYPLGYMPGNDAQQNFQMADDYPANYPTLEPHPWKEGRGIPNNAFEEVMKEWTARTLPRTEHPCRKIVFTLTSHDQGWGGGPTAQGQYDGSFSWFDVGAEEMSVFKEDSALEAWDKAPWPQIRLNYDKSPKRREAASNTAFRSPLVCSLRTVVPETFRREPRPHYAESDDEDEEDNNLQAPDNPGPSRIPPQTTKYEFRHELCPTDGVLQKNVVADRESKTHVITWSYTDSIHPESPEADEMQLQGRGKVTGSGEYVRNMKLGDCITIWAKARFSGWVNVVEKVEIDVYWAI